MRIANFVENDHMKHTDNCLSLILCDLKCVQQPLLEAMQVKFRTKITSDNTASISQSN